MRHVGWPEKDHPECGADGNESYDAAEDGNQGAVRSGGVIEGDVGV
jgi:hypothetical protein